MKHFTLCADDFALSSAVSQAIVTLFEYGRINATSCLVNTHYWEEHSAWLHPYKETQSIGLHFNLTLGRPLSDEAKQYWPNGLPTLKKLVVECYRKQLPQPIVEAELIAQLDQFQEHMNMPPCFLDGHQHAHHLPVIRDAVIAVHQRHLSKDNCSIRIVNNSIIKTLLAPNNKFKRFTLQMLGGNKLAKAVKKLDITYNTSFAGIYNFSNAKEYAELFPTFLADIKNNGLIMCHPGLSAKNKVDDIAEHRVHEYDYLMSERFLADCQQVGAQLR